MHQLRQYLHPLAYHVSHLPWFLRFYAVTFIVRHGHLPLDFLERGRGVGVVVFILLLYVAVGDVDLVAPRLPCFPLHVCHQDVGCEVVVDDYAKTLGFHRGGRESLAIHCKRLAEIEHRSREVDVMPSDVHRLWSVRSLHDCRVQLMELVLVDSAEVADVRGPKEGVRYCLSDNCGYYLRHSFLHYYHCKVESVLSVRFLAGVVLADFWGEGDL